MNRTRGIALLAVLAVAAMPSASHAQNAPTATAADALLEEIRAANDLRAALARERTAWDDEHARLAILQATLSAERTRYADSATASREAAAALVREAEAAAATAPETAALNERIAQVAARLHRSLDALATRSLPGVVPVEPPSRDPVESLRNAIARIEHAERESAATRVEIVTGMRGAQPLAVRLLRIGSGLAWWEALDGSSAGTARVTETGALRLDDAAGPHAAAAIVNAIAMASGQSIPALVPLPVPAPERRP